MFNMFKRKSKNYIESIDVDKISDEKLQSVADQAFSAGSHLEHEDKNRILDNGKTLEQNVKDGYKNAIRAQQLSPNPKFHRSYEEKDLSYSFQDKHKKDIKEYEDKIYNLDDEVVCIKKSKKYSLKYSKEEIINICEEEINTYNNFKKYCYNFGRGGELYFQDMWEYCHYNWNDCFP